VCNHPVEEDELVGGVGSQIDPLQVGDKNPCTVLWKGRRNVEKEEQNAGLERKKEANDGQRCGGNRVQGGRRGGGDQRGGCLTRNSGLVNDPSARMGDWQPIVRP